MACRGKFTLSQLRTCPLVGSSRRVDIAAVERYNTIRTFFRRQMSHSTKPPLMTKRPKLLLSISISLGRGPYSRSFHSSISRYNQQPHENNSPSQSSTATNKPSPESPKG
ncbi:hypothetical protein QCA50_004116 [Cerrena zonata]|uniref:Uncharacterized protein n=1 Tax=Cerrena zonata TaxID=2478898 RepID=A0AAW0GSF9_9APHY